MKKYGVDTSNITTSLLPTGHAIIMIDKDAENVILVDGGANNDYEEPFFIPKEFIDAYDFAKFLIIQNEVNYENNKEIAIYCMKHDTRVYADFWDKRIFSDEIFFKSIYSFNPNKPEFSDMIGLKEDSWNLKTITHEILMEHFEKFSKTLNFELKHYKFCIKMGEEGSLFFDERILVKMPSISTLNPKVLGKYPIIDTVGAGDSFMAAFAHKHSKVENIDSMSDEVYIKVIEGILFFSNICGFLATTKKGAQTSPGKTAINELRDEFFPEFKHENLKEFELGSPLGKHIRENIVDQLSLTSEQRNRIGSA